MQFTIGALSNYDKLIATKAASTLMDTTVADWRGKPAKLRSITDELGTSDNVFLAARHVAMELLKARTTFHDAYQRPTAMIPKALTRALNHFYGLMHDDLDLASMGMGRGQMLLIQMDSVIEQHLKNQSRDKGRLVS
jgi:hypothetical protein